VNGLTEVERVGDTMRRETGPWTPAVHALLRHLEAVGFDAAPRVLGFDEQGREVLTFVEGEEASWSEDELAAVGRVIREYHDAVASFEPQPDAQWQVLVGTPREHEVVCHNDLSPCNTVFRDGVPFALIDFDDAAPGARLDDLGYALFLWLNIGTDGPAPDEQARRIVVFCDAYGTPARAEIVGAIEAAVARTLERLRADGRTAELDWWQAQLAWLERHGAHISRRLY